MHQNNASSELVPIALDYLYDGMESPDDIYNFDRKVMLVKKGDILDKTKIRRIRKFNRDMKNILVTPNTFTTLVETAITQGRFSHERLEKESGYAELQVNVKNFLDSAASIDYVEYEQVEEISENLIDSLPSDNIANILQCIIMPRPMDNDLEKHCLNVSLLNGMIGKWLDFSNEDIEKLVISGLVHDIGKTKIPSEILNAPRKLTEEEFEIVKNHPIYSHDILKKNDKFCEEILGAVNHHHENFLGGGYPANLFGTDIPLFARITAISDVFDAMVSKRAYKGSNGPFVILEQFASGLFKNLDKKLLAIFIKNLPVAYIGKSALFSDGTFGTIRHVMPNDIKYPIVDIDGVIKQTTDDWTCEKIIIDDE